MLGLQNHRFQAVWSRHAPVPLFSRFPDSRDLASRVNQVRFKRCRRTTAPKTPTLKRELHTQPVCSPAFRLGSKMPTTPLAWQVCVNLRPFAVQNRLFGPKTTDFSTQTSQKTPTPIILPILPPVATQIPEDNGPLGERSLPQPIFHDLKVGTPLRGVRMPVFRPPRPWRGIFFAKNRLFELFWPVTPLA